ncbi:hypothetical protein HDV01_005466 [Terramyces sp. JEL0728]|nr:hypothetical protein HDV01_005466 [Terramyces sp. JEL0728]
MIAEPQGVILRYEKSPFLCESRAAQMNPRWQDFETFHAEPTKYYQNLYKTPLDSTRKRRLNKATNNNFAIASLNPADKKRLAKLIQCLAISESQRKHLQSTLDEITLQREDYQTQIAGLKLEKQKLVEKENYSIVEYEKVKREIASKNMEIGLLQKKLRDMEDSKVESPTLTNTTALDEKLSRIQQEIANLTIAIPKIANSIKHQEPKAVDNFKVAIDEISGFSTADTFQSSDSSSNLENMLRKILKRKVHYNDDKPQKKEMSVENAGESSTSEKILKPFSSEVEIEPSKLKNTECQTEDPKPETYATSVQTIEQISKSVQTREPRVNTNNTLLDPKPATKKPSTDQVSCSCPTCSSQYSWVCPGCTDGSSRSTTKPKKNHERRPSLLDEPIQDIHTISLIPADESILYANDTSMIKSLIDVVSDLETENVRIRVHGDSTGYGESSFDDDVIDIISSLNGLD